MNVRQAQLPEGWEIRKLKELGITQTGTTPKTSEKENFGDYIPFIKPADVDFESNGKLRYDNDGLSEIGLSKSRKIEKNSIFMVCIGATIGKVGFSEIEATCNQQINTLTLLKDYCPKFFYYGMTTNEFQDKVLMEGKGAQATLPIINKSKWENLTLPYPKSLPEQQRIVSILDEALASIAKAKANAEQNLKNAKELFESYLQGVFEKGDWEKKKLNEVTEVKDGTHDSPKYIKDGIPFVTQKNIKQDGLSFDDTRFITDTDHEKFYKRSNVTYGDILISMIGANRGMAAIVDDKRIFSIKNVGLIKSSENINMNYLLYYLKSIEAMKYVLYMSNGGAQEFVGLTALRSFPIPYPPLNEQQTIVRRLDALRTETQKLESIYQKKLDDLEELKKSILQKAFAGELKSPEGVVYNSEAASPLAHKKAHPINSPEGVR